MNLTREQAIEEHRKMWNWIADETEKREQKVYKDEYLRNKGIVLYLDCFLCDYCNKYGMLFLCSECPLDWGCTYKGKYQCEYLHEKYDYEGYFAQWRITGDWNEAARLARIIANLPERNVK